MEVAYQAIPTPERMPAGFWIRFVAALIDGLIYGFVWFIISMPLSAAMLASGQVPHASDMPLSPLNVISTTISFAIEAAFLSSAWQATPGKRILGIYVIREDGGRLTFANAFGRCLAKLLSYVILFVGYIMAAFTREKVALHDLLASTRVIYGKK